MNILVPILALAACSASQAEVLWDQSNLLNARPESFVNQVFPDFPTFSTYIVDDVKADHWHIHSMSILVDRSSSKWLSGVRSAVFSTFRKKAPLGPPPPSYHPENGRRIFVQVIDRLLTYEIRTENLNADLDGLSWISLTPIASFSTVRQCFDFSSRQPFGTRAFFTNPGWGFGAELQWNLVSWFAPFHDQAMRIEGTRN